MKMLMKRLGVEGLDSVARLRELDVKPEEVLIPLHQHVGEPALPVVSIGDRVQKGDLVGKIPEGKLGAEVHASIAGSVTGVDSVVAIERIGN